MKEYVFYEEFDPLYYFSGQSQNWCMNAFHYHKNYEIILFMSEDAKMNIENRVYAVDVGDLFLLNQKEYHKTSGKKETGYKRYVLMFDPDQYRPLCQLLGYDFLRFFEDRPENFIHKINLSGTNLVTVIQLLEDIGRLHNAKEEPAVGASLMLKIIELLIVIQDLFSFFTQNMQQPSFYEVENIEFGMEVAGKIRTESIKRYIKDHISEKLALQDIANFFFLNKHYLSHYFKKETGFSMSEYIQNQKIAAAKRMLKQGYSVTETALSLGYKSDSYFIDVFKKLSGTTPKKYVLEKKISK